MIKVIRVRIIIIAAICVIISAAAGTAFYLLKENESDYAVANKPGNDTVSTQAERSNEEMKPVVAEGFPKGINAVISPRVELLAGVLSQTSWIENRGPKGKGNKYYCDLKEYFSKYKNHKAVQIAEKLTIAGFTYDAPLNYVLSLKEPPSLQHEGEYTDYQISRSGGKKNLEEFTAALNDLSREMDFPSFFESHRAELQGYVDKSVKEFGAEKVLNWLKNFYGEVDNKGDFYLVFAPAMFPNGGYAASIPDSTGKLTVYQIIRENGVSENDVNFPKGTDLELLALHEWGHSYVNLSLQANNSLLEKYQINKLYKPVEERMKKMAYGVYTTFMNEQVLRSAVAVAAKELYGESKYETILKYEKNNGFYLTEFTVEQLDYYSKNRDKYKDFKDFVPYLLEQYNKNMDKLLEQAPK